MRTRMYLWVTSDCNLSCRYCSQQYTMKQHKGYQMEMEELLYFIESCKKRNIRFDVIEITGGEPSLWKHIKEGIELLKEICDEITLVTNGNNPPLILSLNLPCFIVSASQANQAQIAQYSQSGRKILYNTHKHKKMPEKAVENALPAICCVRQDSFGKPQVAMEYIAGKVYYCCDAFAHTELAGMSDEIVCDFEDDFIAKFSNKSYNLAICQFCLCNQKIWDVL